MIPRIKSVLKITETVPFLGRRLTCWTAAITKKRRENYLRTYPTVLILPDGSSLNIQYHEPRKIVKLPLDLTLLSEEERKARLDKRITKTKVKIVEEELDDFDEGKYLNMSKI